MRLLPTLLLLLVILASTVSAQFPPEMVGRDTTALRLRRLGVTMIRTWQITDTTQETPDPCDIWDTTLVVPLKDGGVKTIFFAYRPIGQSDWFNEHICREKSTDEFQNMIGIPDENGNPKVIFPEGYVPSIDRTPNDTLTKTYDSQGYIIATTTNKCTKDPFDNRYWYLDRNKRIIARSRYGCTGFEDSTYFEYDGDGRLSATTSTSQVIGYKDSAQRVPDYSGRRHGGSRWLHDSLGRIAFKIGMRGDTGHAWHYLNDSTTVRTYYLTYGGSRGNDTAVTRDSLRYDEHGNIIGWTRETRRRTGLFRETFIDRERVEILQIDARGRVESRTERVVDSNGNLLSVSWTTMSGKRRVVTEHDYSKNGLRVATRIYRTENGKSWLWRQFRYLYSFR